MNVQPTNLYTYNFKMTFDYKLGQINRKPQRRVKPIVKQVKEYM